MWVKKMQVFSLNSFEVNSLPHRTFTQMHKNRCEKSTGRERKIEVHEEEKRGWGKKIKEN